ncbi:MAG: cellulase family glycosylhydrolase [Planctomycetota bacterium]
MKRILMALSFLSLFGIASAADSIFTKFVYREGSKLMDENGEYRFISFNVPCLHYSEDNVGFTETNPWRLTDEFEITDALESVREMGGQVIRIYTLSVRISGEDPNIPRHILGPGRFDEEAFKSLDMVLAVANRKGIRVIFPFIDNWKWWGGIGACAAFRGKQADDFWTDEQLFEDYKKIVSFVINRTNSITGVKYRDDKAVLAWETGNELLCPHEWTAKAAEFIKSIDKNHLVIDGFHTMALREQSIEDKNVDIVTTHFYPVMFFTAVTPADMIDHIKRNAALARGKKPYFVGEFGFIPTQDVDSLLQAVMNEKISGALIWSLRFHNRDGGFYWHSEPHGGDKYKSYHWPGFACGEAYDEKGLLNLMRRKAFEIRNMAVAAIEKPAAPVLLDINDPAAISWQGSAGAQSYSIERSESKDGPWLVVGSDISDAVVQYRPLFNDTGVEVGKSYYYRVIAKNSAGVSEPSNVVGPVPVSFKTLVDEMQDWKFTHKRNGKLSLETGESRKFKEDSHRLKGTKDAYIIYQVDLPINSFKIYSFYPDKISDFKFYTSADGQNFKPAKFSRHDYFTGKGDYNYYPPVLYEGNILEENAGYLKVEYATEAQIARVEIRYGQQTTD